MGFLKRAERKIERLADSFLPYEDRKAKQKEKLEKSKQKLKDAIEQAKKEAGFK